MLKWSESALELVRPVTLAGMTIAGGSDDATDDGSVSVVLVIGATVEGLGICNSGGIGCPVNSLKVALRLLETRVSITIIDEL